MRWVGAVINIVGIKMKECGRDFDLFGGSMEMVGVGWNVFVGCLGLCGGCLHLIGVFWVFDGGEMVFDVLIRHVNCWYSSIYISMH